MYARIYVHAHTNAHAYTHTTHLVIPTIYHAWCQVQFSVKGPFLGWRLDPWPQVGRVQEVPINMSLAYRCLSISLPLSLCIPFLPLPVKVNGKIVSMRINKNNKNTFQKAKYRKAKSLRSQKLGLLLYMMFISLKMPPIRRDFSQ